MKVLIAAGGTGGHIYPGIAVAREIMRRDSNSTVKFVGTNRGLETKLVPDNGFELLTIESVGLKNVGLMGQLKGLMVLPRSFFEARKLLRELGPDVVIGAGGYVSGPVLLTASLMGFPTLVMDSNALPGFTNRRLAWFVDRAALTFEAALPFFGKKGTVTGNPVREEFFAIVPKIRVRDKFCILVFGGSQGARAINNAVVEALPFLEEFKESIKFTHQTGESDFPKIDAAYKAAGWGDVEVSAYIGNMPEHFGKNDLIICRAGATTCAELSAAGKASIMVPLPTAADDHQRKNAEALESAGAAKMILQKDLSGSVLADEIRNLIEDPDRISSMEREARKLARADAAEVTVDLIENLVKRK